jgi:hypothetical protein
MIFKIYKRSLRITLNSLFIAKDKYAKKSLLNDIECTSFIDSEQSNLFDSQWLEDEDLFKQPTSQVNEKSNAYGKEKALGYSSCKDVINRNVNIAINSKHLPDINAYANTKNNNSEVHSNNTKCKLKRDLDDNNDPDTYQTTGKGKGRNIEKSSSKKITRKNIMKNKKVVNFSASKMLKVKQPKPIKNRDTEDLSIFDFTE